MAPAELMPGDHGMLRPRVKGDGHYAAGSVVAQHTFRCWGLGLIVASRATETRPDDDVVMLLRSRHSLSPTGSAPGVHSYWQHLKRCRCILMRRILHLGGGFHHRNRLPSSPSRTLPGEYDENLESHHTQRILLSLPVVRIGRLFRHHRPNRGRHGRGRDRVWPAKVGPRFRSHII